MSIGIIGAGALGSNVARLLAKSWISATIANHRGPQSLANLVEELGSSIKALTVEETAKADIVARIEQDTLVDVGAPLTSLPFGSLGSINFIKI